EDASTGSTPLDSAAAPWCSLLTGVGDAGSGTRGTEGEAMKRIRWGVVGLLAGVLAVAVAAGSPAGAQQPDAEKAKAEKKIVSYGQPDDWANWKEIWQVFCSRYGCTHEDTDMSSAEEISKFKAERANPVADTAEIGMIWGPVAVKEGVTAPYK